MAIKSSLKMLEDAFWKVKKRRKIWKMSRVKEVAKDVVYVLNLASIELKKRILKKIITIVT